MSIYALRTNKFKEFTGSSKDIPPRASLYSGVPETNIIFITSSSVLAFFNSGIADAIAIAVEVTCDTSTPERSALPAKKTLQNYFNKQTNNYNYENTN